jgi:hypothetical protein
MSAHRNLELERLDLLAQGFDQLYNELTDMKRGRRQMMVSVKRLNQLIAFASETQQVMSVVWNSHLSCDDIRALPASAEHIQTLLEGKGCV